MAIGDGKFYENWIRYHHLLEELGKKETPIQSENGIQPFFYFSIRVYRRFLEQESDQRSKSSRYSTIAKLDPRVSFQLVQNSICFILLLLLLSFYLFNQSIQLMRHDTRWVELYIETIRKLLTKYFLFFNWEKWTFYLIRFDSLQWLMK